jgi:alpha-L-fucosidase
MKHQQTERREPYAQNFPGRNLAAADIAAPVIPGKLAYSEWYWNAMTHGKDRPKANAIETATWAFHQNMYGADFPYQNFAPQFRAELFDPAHWADVFAYSGAR